MYILEFDTGYFQKTDWFYLGTHTFTSADVSVNTTAYTAAINKHVTRSKQNISTVCKSKFSFDCIFTVTGPYVLPVGGNRTVTVNCTQHRAMLGTSKSGAEDVKVEL
jgi:hypothetical protein